MILPLKLLAFSGTYQSNLTRLKWTTQGEYDFEKFIVERSVNGRDFKEVGIKLSGGNRNSITDYSFSDDVSVVRGEVFYYRLKMMDIGGQVSYSGVVTIRRVATGSGVTVFPNPVKQSAATVTITAVSEGLATISVLDVSGKILWTKTYRLNAGTNSIVLEDLSRLPQGVYTLQVAAGGQVINKQIVIVK